MSGLRLDDRTNQLYRPFQLEKGLVSLNSGLAVAWPCPSGFSKGPETFKAHDFSAYTRDHGVHQNYSDILQHVDRKPVWFDEVGVPRFCDFAPSRLNNIYAREVALTEIGCQSCGHLFHVALTGAFAARGRSLGDEIKLGRVHYGDPPNIDCCGSGNTINSEMHRIVEYWSRFHRWSRGWQRDSSFEGTVTKSTFDPPDALAVVEAGLKQKSKTFLLVSSSSPNQYVVGEDLCPKLIALSRGTHYWPWERQAKCRLLVLCDDETSIVARKMATATISESDVGYSKSDLPVVVAQFSEIANLQSVPAFVLVLSGHIRPADFARKNKDKAADWLNKLKDRTIIEIALNEDEIILRNPDIAFDGRFEKSSVATD